MQKALYRCWIILFLLLSNDDALQGFGRHEYSHTLSIHSNFPPHSAQPDRQICQQRPLEPSILVYMGALGGLENT